MPSGSHSVPKILFILALLFAASLPVRAETPELSLRVTAADPSGTVRLGQNDPLFLRVSYNSPVPIRLQAKGFFGGAERIKGAAYNPAPASPAGAHDALVWVSYTGPARIDTVRITAYGADWKPLATLAYPVSAEWWGSPGSRTRPAWVRTLNAEQQARASSAMTAGMDDADNTGIGILITLAFLSIPAYIALQLVLLMRYSGGWRIAAAVPLIGMVPLLLYTLLALVMGSNLWPLLAIFLTPFALLYLVAVLGLRRIGSGAAFS